MQTDSTPPGGLLTLGITIGLVVPMLAALFVALVALARSRQGRGGAADNDIAQAVRLYMAPRLLPLAIGSMVVTTLLVGCLVGLGLIWSAPPVACPTNCTGGNVTCNCSSDINVTGLIATINDIEPDANNNFQVLAGTGIAVSGGTNSLTISASADVTNPVTTINDIAPNASHNFALVAGDNVTLTPLPNGLMISSVGGPPGPQGDTGPPGQNGTCGCNGTQGIRTINSLMPDGNLNFDIMAGSGISITPFANSITLSVEIPDPVAYINGLTPNANHSFSITGGSGVTVTPGANSLIIGLVIANPVAYINSIAPDSNHSFVIQGGTGVTVTGGTNSLTIGLAVTNPVAYINSIAPDANHSFTIAGGSGITVTPGVSGITISLTFTTAPITYINGLPPNANHSFTIQGGTGITVTPGVNAITIDLVITNPVAYINNVAPDSNHSFTIAAGAGIGVTTGTNQITVTALVPDPVATINNVAPDVNHDFTIAAGSGVAVTPGTNSLTVSALVPDPVATINNVAPDVNHDFTIAAGSGVAVTPGTNSLTVSALVPDPVATINGVAPNATHNFQVLAGTGIAVAEGTNSITVSASADVLNPVTTINGVAPNASHNFALQGANHVLITAITNGQQLATDGTPYNNASTLVARDGDGGFEASVITATEFVVHTNGSYVFELWGPGETNPRFAIDEYGTLEWGPGNSARDIELSRDNNGALQLVNNMRINGWIQVGVFSDQTPTSDDEGDVTCKRLRAWPYTLHDAWPLGNGPNGAFVNMTGTMTLTNTSGPFAPGAVGFLAQYELQPSAVQDTTGTFVSGALTLVFAGDTDMTGTAVGGRAAVEITGKAAAGALVGLDATVRVTSDRQAWGVVTNIAIVGTTNGYTVGTYVGITGCGGSGAIFQVLAPLGPSNSIANFQIVAGGHSYSSSLNCTCTILNGTGSTVFVNLVLTGNAQYQQVVGVRAQAFDASQSYGYMRPIDLVGVLVQQSYASLNATYPSGTLTQRGVYVKPQLLGQQYNAAFWADALTGNTSEANYGLYLAGGSGNSSNYGVWVGQQGLSGANSLNIGVQIAPPASGATGSAALRLQSDQSTAAVGGILWGSGADSPNANLYRSAAGTLKTDGSLTVTLDMSARTITAQQFRALPPNSTDVTFLTRLSGDVDNRLQLTGDGVFRWGDGTATDINLYRAGSQRLQTDQAFTVGLDARVGTYGRVGGTGAPLNTATGDMSATRLMLGSEYALGEPGFSTTLAVVGTVASANASSTVTTSCGSNTTILLSPGAVTSGTYQAQETALTMRGDTDITGTGYADRTYVKLERAGGGSFVGMDVSVRVTTNVPSTSGLLAVAVTAGGTGYTVGNQLTVTGGGGSGGTVLVATVSSGVVTAVTMERPGSGYSTGTGRATTGGSGSGCTINIVSVGSTTYSTLNGAQFTAYSASGTYATPTLPGTVRGVLINDIDLGSSAQVVRPTTQIGLSVAVQTQGSTSNIGINVGGGASALTGVTNTGVQVNAQTAASGFNNGVIVTGSTGTGATNRGIVVTAATGTNATNRGIEIVGPTGGGSSTNIGLQITQPSGGTGLQQALWLNTQATTASAGILFGDNSDTTKANLYRGAASQVKCDGDIMARHFLGSGSAPSATGGAAAGTGPTITVSGTDNGFSVQVTIGTSPASSNRIFTVTYAVAYSQTVYPVFSPADGNTGTISGTAGLFLASVSASGFQFWMGGPALTAGQPYTWNFKV